MGKQKTTGRSLLFKLLRIVGYFAAAAVARAVLVLVLMQRVQVLTLWPSTILYCKFGNKRRIEARMLWDRFIVRE
jgi:hypothetical protein